MPYKYYKLPIPKGFTIFVEKDEVAGVDYRKSAALLFIGGKNQTIRFERDPRNKHDKNAIKIIGCYNGFLGMKKERHIGYVPREVAAQIVRSGLFSQLVPRLMQSDYYQYENKEGDTEWYVKVTFDILGPKELYRQFDDCEFESDAEGKKSGCGRGCLILLVIYLLFTLFSWFIDWIYN